MGTKWVPGGGGINGLPADLDLSPLIGREVGFVGFGQHQVQLGFDGDNVHISIESDYAVRGRDGREQRFVAARDGAAPLVALLGSTVAAASGSTDGTLTVAFTSGATLTIYESDDPYESYQLHFGEGLIIV